MAKDIIAMRIDVQEIVEGIREMVKEESEDKSEDESEVAISKS